jgi:vacuolar-type H+-ATPase subunit I/STV1
MKKILKWLTFIFIVLGFGYILYSKRDQLKDKLKSIEEKIKQSNFSQDIKAKFEDTINSIKSLIEKDETVDKSIDDTILNIVEEKIRRLEELIHQEVKNS